MKIVLDTNVLIAAFATRGLCEALFEHCLENHEIVLSEQLLTEVGGKLRSKLRLPEKTAEDILGFLRDHSTIWEPSEVPADACRDADDLAVLGTAEAARASYIVTGDQDLLVLETFREIPILTPRKFWDRESMGADEKG